MKIEIKTVYFERLPAISMPINVEPLDCIRRLEEIARANKQLEVRCTLDGDGVHHCNVVSFAERAERKHEGLFAMMYHWNHYGKKLELQLAAHRWNPDPPTYNCYVAAARRLFQPIIDAYNLKYHVRHRMRIETREDLLPRMTPKAKQAFDHFVVTANKSALHPLDWEKFYYFTRVSYQSRHYLCEDDIRWLCRRAGFSKEQSESLGLAYVHCYHFYEALKKQRLS